MCECVHKNNVSARRWASNKKALAAPDIFSRPRLPIVSLVSHSLWALFAIYRDAITVTSVSLTSICHRRIWRMHLFSPDKSTKGTQTRPTICVSALSQRKQGASRGRFADTGVDLHSTFAIYCKRWCLMAHTVIPAVDVTVAWPQFFLILDFFNTWRDI